jgi:hypothetical protein
MRKIYDLLLLAVLIFIYSGTSAQVEMIAAGAKQNPIANIPVSNVQATISDPLTGEVNISWECIPSSGFSYYTVKRDGVQLGTTDVNSFGDVLPTYGTYTYCIEAIYASGSTPASCSQVEWANPNMVWSPDEITQHIYPNGMAIGHLTISNTGQGSLYFSFPEYTGKSNRNPLVYCTTSVSNPDIFISRVQINTINQSSGWAGYNDYTALSTDLVRGLSMPITVTIGPLSYSAEITGVWVDFDHNSVFDESEFTALTGSSIATGFISVPPTALPGPTTMRVRTQYGGTLSPCGESNFGEVEDYTVNIKDPTFITSIVPTSGIVSAGASVSVLVMFSAAGIYSLPGTYTKSLTLSSNDLSHSSVTIPGIMIVGLGGSLEGVVSDSIGNPLNGVLVKAGLFSTMTNESGAYSMNMDPGTYNVTFSKLGYQTVIVSGFITIDGNTTSLNAQMWEEPYPPSCAYAEVNPEDTQCTLTWCLPSGPYEMLYDDGTPENSVAWSLPGNMNAVKFSPQGYPATISGARFYIGDGVAGSSIGTTLTAEVYSADVSGLPGILLDSASVTISVAGWVEVADLNAMITGGDFFIVMVQNEPSPDCPYLGVDETLPTAYMSYSRDINSGGGWVISPYQDFMIRAIVSSPVAGDDKVAVQAVNPLQIKGMISQKKPEAIEGFQGMKAIISAPAETDNILSAESYNVYRIPVIDPNAPVPSAGPSYLIANTAATTYVDGPVTWNALPQGWYAYGIQAIYPNGEQSTITYTNIVGNRKTADLTINLQLSCNTASPGGTIVWFRGLDYPYENYTSVLSASGTASFNPVYKGDYMLSVHLSGYEDYESLISIDSNLVLNVMLDPVTFPPRNLYVNDETLITTWETPLAILLEENFESGIYPPTGWQSTTAGSNGWHVSTDGSSGGFSVPPHTAYAVVNDDEGGPGNNGCCDYLITPPLNLTVAPYFFLSFQSYFSGAGGQMAYVEMSTDGGSTWTPIYTCSQAASWQQVEIDFSTYSGTGGFSNVLLAFHADDGGNQASGWAVDDIVLRSGNLPVDTYSVMLDGVEVGQTTNLMWAFDPATLNCGQEYSVCVSAVYCGVHSENVCDSLSDFYHYPPLNLAVDTSITTTSGAAVLSWDSPSAGCLPLLGYNIYRDWELIANLLPPIDSVYWDMNLLPGYYCYYITAVYDHTPMGFPGSTDESQAVGPACTDIIYGADLPFADDFSSGQFNPAMWIPGLNWLIDSESDNPVPAAKFKWDPLLQNYSSALESFWINATTTDSSSFYNIWFDYDIKLNDAVSLSTEKLTVEVWDSTNWIPAREYFNNGSFDWMHVHLNISELSKDRVFKVRFRANGISSDAVDYWAIDNVTIYTETAFLPPLSLVAVPVTPEENDVQLMWSPPSEGDNYDTLSGYNVYRSESGKKSGEGNKSSNGDFVNIATVNSPGYSDMDLPVFPINCYEYYITALYGSNESASSNYATACLYTEISKNEPQSVKIYPNPAKTYIRIDLTKEVTGISIYNLLGIIISEKKVKGENSLTINTTAYPSGVYSVNFTSLNGDSFCRKFIITQ